LQTFTREYGMNFFSADERGSSGQTVEEVFQRDTQDSRNQTQVEDRHVALPTLDRADEGTVQVATAGQLGLCPATRKPVLPEALSQVTEKSLVIEVHGA